MYTGRHTHTHTNRILFLQVKTLLLWETRLKIYLLVETKTEKSKRFYSAWEVTLKTTKCRMSNTVRQNMYLNLEVGYNKHFLVEDCSRDVPDHESK